MTSLARTPGAKLPREHPSELCSRQAWRKTQGHGVCVWGCDRTGHQVAPSPNPWCARMWPKSVRLGTQGQCRGLGSLQQARGSSHSACGTQDLSSPQMPTGSEASQLSSFREHRAALRKQAAPIRQHAAVSTITDRIHRADVHPYSAQLHQGT